MKLGRTIGRFHRNQSGAMGIFVAISIATLIGFAVMAIDISTMALVKTQLQDAADAGALAGAQELFNDDTTAAVSEAIDFAGKNDALIYAGAGQFNTMDSVKITSADVTFPESKKITVTTHRTQATGDPFRTYFMRVINPAGAFANMSAKATAGFFWVCGAKCVKPWAPPDRWFDADTTDGTFNAAAGDFYDPQTTGYTNNDIGVQITLKLGNSNKEDFGQDWYYAIDYPPLNDGNPISGGDQYREWISGCPDDGVVVDPGDSVVVEPGNMVGPTGQGISDLIALDPYAQWDPVTQEVINSDYPVSPRIIKAALFDPEHGVDHDSNGRPFVVIVKIMVLFLEGSGSSGEVTGRFIRMNEPGGTACEDQNDPTFLYKTSLIE